MTGQTRRAFLAGLVLAGSGSGTLAAAAPPRLRTARYQFTELDPAQPMLPLALQRPDGHAYAVAPAAGRPMLLYAWARWCAICRRELPRLDRQLGAFARHGIDIVAVNTDKRDDKALRLYLKRLGIDRLPVAVDPSGAIMAAPRPDGVASPFVLYMGLPIFFVIDSQGLVRGYMQGEVDWATPEGEALLAYYGGL